MQGFLFINYFFELLLFGRGGVGMVGVEWGKGKMPWEYSVYSHRLLLETQWWNLGSISSKLELSQSAWLYPYIGGKVFVLNTSALYTEFLSAVGYRKCALFVM